MKLVIISDTHNLHDKITLPEGDVLIHCGDFSGLGSTKEILSFNKFLGSLSYKHKLILPGNHDLLCEKDPGYCKALFTNGTLLIDELIEIEGKKLYFSPWTPEFGNWGFMMNRYEIGRAWENIPEGVDVLVTHGPPSGILDVVLSPFGVKSVGCEALRRKVLEIKPKIHAFGHIHGGYGTSFQHGINFINAAICDDRYKPINNPIVVTI